MSGPTVKVITNSKGSGDYVIVTHEDEVAFEGHSVSPVQLYELLRALDGGYENLSFHELTDKQMENWQEAIYE